MVEKQSLRYEGKAKRLYDTDKTGVLWVEYLDQATALNGKRKDHIEGKGALNNQITSLIFKELNRQGVATHFIDQLSKTEQLNKSVEIIPLEVVVRNVSAGSFAKRFGIEEGIKLSEPIIEFYYKSDELDDPFINEAHVKYLDIATATEVALIKEQALKVNQLLLHMFSEIELTLIDFKLEFGRLPDGSIILADEISPDTARLWDVEGHHMDKDIYRRDLGDVTAVYAQVYQKLEDRFA